MSTFGRYARTVEKEEVRTCNVIALLTSSSDEEGVPSA